MQEIKETLGVRYERLIKVDQKCKLICYYNPKIVFFYNKTIY